jgi:hypothetical protein
VIGEAKSSRTLSLAKTLGVLSFTPLTMLQACAQAVDFKVGHHFGGGMFSSFRSKPVSKFRTDSWTSDGLRNISVDPHQIITSRSAPDDFLKS